MVKSTEHVTHEKFALTAIRKVMVCLYVFIPKFTLPICKGLTFLSHQQKIVSSLQQFVSMKSMLLHLRFECSPQGRKTINSQVNDLYECTYRFVS